MKVVFAVVVIASCLALVSLRREVAQKSEPRPVAHLVDQADSNSIRVTKRFSRTNITQVADNHLSQPATHMSETSRVLDSLGFSDRVHPLTVK